MNCISHFTTTEFINFLPQIRALIKSVAEETPTSSRQDTSAERRYGNVPSRVQKRTRKFQMSKQNEQKERKKKPVFDSAVALCTIQTALLVISNLT
jgi:predicted glycoside hydrolase/deacetylase ChbG (UPF0249 family)